MTDSGGWPAATATWRRFLPHLRAHAPRLALVILLTLLVVACELLRPWPIQWIFDNALAPVDSPAREPAFYVVSGALALLTIVMLRALLEYVAKLQTTRVSHSVTRSLRNAIFAHLCRLSPAFHAQHKTGDLLVRLMGDVPILRAMLVDSSVALASRAVLVVGTVAVMLAVDAFLTVVVLALLPLVAFAVRLLARRLTVAVRKQRRKEGHLADYLHEAIGAATLIQSLGREGDTAREFARSNRTAARAEMKAARLAARMSATVESLLGLGTAVALGVGAWRVLEGALTAGELIVFLSYVRSLAKPLRSASRHADRIAKGSACGERVLHVLDAPVEIESRPGARTVPAVPEELAFEGVHFRYPDGSTALAGVDAVFRRGGSTALFGRSGAGKSTLAALAIRLFDPTAGRVLLDGVDLRDYDLQALRDRFGVSLQETVLLGATIRENLELGLPGASAERMWQACRLAGAAEFVARLPEGLDTLLGASGVGLSGGERRRLCLARALLRGSPVLIADEPFSGLDRPAALHVYETLQHAAAERIVIVITHDRTHLDLFDHVLFLEDGRVRDAGSHDQLRRRDPAYRSMTAAEVEATSP